MTAATMQQWLAASIHRIEALPPSTGRDKALETLRAQVERYRANADTIAKLLEPRSVSDWLDRRAGIEAGDREASHLKFAQDWLARHHPRFGGREAR